MILTNSCFYRTHIKGSVYQSVRIRYTHVHTLRYDKPQKDTVEHDNWPSPFQVLQNVARSEKQFNNEGIFCRIFRGYMAKAAQN